MWCCVKSSSREIKLHQFGAKDASRTLVLVSAHVKKRSLVVFVKLLLRREKKIKPFLLDGQRTDLIPKPIITDMPVEPKIITKRKNRVCRQKSKKKVIFVALRLMIYRSRTSLFVNLFSHLCSIICRTLKFLKSSIP